jgi:hypothetical protein
MSGLQLSDEEKSQPVKNVFEILEKIGEGMHISLEQS